MIYLLVFMASAITAIVGPWVEAPLSLSTLSGLVAIATVFLAVRNGQIEVEVTDNHTNTKKTSGDATLNNDASAPMTANDSDSCEAKPNSTTLTELRIKSLEEEIHDLKSQNTALARERIELIRKAATANASSATRQSAQAANTNELTHALRRRDSWIQAQQASMSELRNNISNLKNTLDALVDTYEKRPREPQKMHSTISPITNSTETAARVIKEIGGKIARTIHHAKSLAETLPSASKIGQTVNLAHLTALLSSMDRRLDEIADRTRVSALNARLLSERAITGESLSVFAEELADIAEKTTEISRESATMTPAIEKIKFDLDINLDSAQKSLEDTTAFLSNIDSDLNTISHSITSLGDEITAGFDRATQSLNAIQETLAIEYNSSTDTLDLVEKMSVIASSIDITLERLIEISKITTAGTQSSSANAET